MCEGESIQASLFNGRGELKLSRQIHQQLALFLGMGPEGSSPLPNGRPVASHVRGWAQGTMAMAGEEERR
jgi:hypothetical protein